MDAMGVVETRLTSPGYSHEALEEAIRGILQAVCLCSISTISPSGKAYTNTAYFCFDEQLNIFFLSDPSTQHCQNIHRNPTTAVAVFGTNQEWGSSLRGLQLFGEAAAIDLERSDSAARIYAARFPQYESYLASLSPEDRRAFPSRFYLFRPQKIKIIDEDRFGDETYVIAQLS